ncbi:MAG: phosphodiester glycosidase family protein [Gemmataceae bacterium]|nr:phosphodiester glycosidase family protein [Gemmata sp.]MDW8196663.1 phosphodiester glycosidase family protein [Gemmataceae bacterium]
MNPWLRVGPLVLVLLAVGGVSSSAQQPFEKARDWKPLFRGIDLVDLQAEQPRLMRGHAVRIDLTTKGLRFFATPSNGERPDHTDGLKTSTFLTRYKCQLAINASPFSPIHKEEGQPQKIEGLTISEGKVVSPERLAYPALLITKDNRVAIRRPPFQLEDIHTAVSGFGIVLEKGQVIKGGKDVHPRTAAGISQDGKTLYFLVIDGRQPKYSEGATTSEVGEWLAALGAFDGINLDGGGTTTLVIEKAGGFHVVNRPIHGGQPGTERVAASHLGVFAPPLEK